MTHPASRCIAIVMAFGAAGSLPACRPDLELHPVVMLECASHDECPEGWACNESTALCVEEGGNAAPALFIDPIARSPAIVQLPVVLVDREGDTVSLRMQFRVGTLADRWSEWRDIDPAHVQPDSSALTTSASGAAHTLAWNIVATAKAVASGAELSTANTLAKTGTAPEELIEVLSYIPRVVVRMQATDSAGNPSDVVDSTPFAVGNNPPTVVLTGWKGALSFDRFVPIEFTLADRAGDPALVSVEYATGISLFARATLIMGDNGLQPVVTSPTPERRVVIWDSRDDLGSGPTLNARVRVRAIDSLDGSQVFLGDWLTLDAPTITND